MSEGDGTKRSAVSSGLVSLFTPHPSFDIVKFWQGIVEIATRGTVLGVTVIVLLTSSVAQAETAHLNENTPLTAARAAAGWVVFVGVVVLTYEIAFIACRFLNFAFMTKYRLICLIIDIIFSGVVSLGIFAGAISIGVGASYTSQFIGTVDQRHDEFYMRVISSHGAAAFFALVEILILAFLAVWMILYIVFKWDIKRGGSSSNVQ